MPFPIKEMAPVPLHSFLERMFMYGALHLYNNKAKPIGQQGGWGADGWTTTFPQLLVPPPPPTLYVSVKSKRHQSDLLTKSQGCQLLEIL